MRLGVGQSAVACPKIVVRCNPDCPAQREKSLFLSASPILGLQSENFCAYIGLQNENLTKKYYFCTANKPNKLITQQIIRTCKTQFGPFRESPASIS